MRRALSLVLPAAAAVGILLLFVLPGRTYLEQQHSLAATEQRVSDLSVENAKLQAEARQLQSTSQIEQIARADYGLVMPGQKAYAIIPSGTTTTTGIPTTSPTTRPASRPASSSGGAAGRSGR